MAAALIQVTPPAIIRIYNFLPVTVNVPGKWQQDGAGVGWKSPDGAYQIVSVPDFVVPDGQMINGPATYSIDPQGNVTQTFPIVPIPPPPPPPPPPPVTFIAYTDFINRLTDPEYIAIKKAIVTQINGGNATVARWYDTISNTGIDTTLPQTATIKAMAVSAGLLTQPRADLVFTP